jgi:hypothetical protein
MLRRLSMWPAAGVAATPIPSRQHSSDAFGRNSVEGAPPQPQAIRQDELWRRVVRGWRVIQSPAEAVVCYAFPQPGQSNRLRWFNLSGVRPVRSGSICSSPWRSDTNAAGIPAA